MGQGWAGQCRARQDRAGQCSAVQCRAGWGSRYTHTLQLLLLPLLLFPFPCPPPPPAWLPACCSECAMCGLPWPTRAPARLADVLGASWLYVVDVTNCLDRVLLLNTTTVVSLGGREGGRCSSVCI